MKSLKNQDSMSELGVWIGLQKNGNEWRWIDGELGNDDNIFWIANLTKVSNDDSLNLYMNENGETDIAKGQFISYFVLCERKIDENGTNSEGGLADDG